MNARIVTSTYRYKRPPRKRTAVPLEGPAIVRKREPRQSDPITALEVRRWLDRFSTGLDSDVYQRVADHFQYMAERRNAPKKKPSHELLADTIVWDFKDVSKAAKIVLANIPIMLSSWDRMLPTPETRAGYEAIRVLGESLSSAMPYVEYPWGYYEENRRHPPKDWHLPAVLIANTITRALLQSGHKRPAMSSGNTILAQIIQTMLERMGHKKIETGAIAQHLLRWYERAGDPNNSE